ncbi:hypothetical protein ACDX78_10475 [Virgibacillus oceani]
MNFEKHFLPKDIETASQEYWCILDLLTSTLEKLQTGDIEAAKQDSIDLLKSLQEMSKMTSEKQQIDRMHEMVNRLNASGVHIEIVKRKLYDQQGY